MCRRATVVARMMRQCRYVIPAVLAGVVLMPGVARAQAAKILEKFTATMAGVNPGLGATVTIDVLRWSTDEEAQKLLAAFKDKGEKQWADVLQAEPSLGYLWASGESLG